MSANQEGSMLDEVYSEIYENVDFTAMDKFEVLIGKTIKKAIIEREDNPNIYSVAFKFGELLDGLTFFASSKGKEHTMKLGSETLLTITQALQFELDPEEAFLLFHLRGLGKFRKRETDLHNELKKLWKQFPEYEMDDRDFSRSLKGLMRDKFINYRRGNILLNPSFVIRYRI